MDIKLKNNIKKTSKKLLIYFATVILLLILCFKFYYWIDINWSATIRNWFSENLMARREISTVDEMYQLSIIEPQWHTIKQIFLITLCIMVVLWATSIFITAWLYAEKKVNQTISNANKMVHFYMIDNMAIPDIYKEENAELIINDKRIENDYIFTADSETMEVKIEFTFDASNLGGKQLVTFEELYDLSNPDEPIKVTEHNDIDDDGQTVTIKEVPETPTPEEPEKSTTPDTPTKTDSPKTGDNTNILAFAIMMSVSAGGLAGTYFFKRRKMKKS